MANSHRVVLSLALLVSAGCAAHDHVEADPGPAPVEPRTKVVTAGPEMSFRSLNYPDRSIRVDPMFMASLAPVIEADADFAAFRVVPGLDGATSSVSFESLQFPGTFLRHQEFQIKLHPFVDAPLYLRDASFKARPGLGGKPGMSFESVNYPGYYIRHRGFMLYIDPLDDSPLYRADATFVAVPRAAL